MQLQGVVESIERELNVSGRADGIQWAGGLERDGRIVVLTNRRGWNRLLGYSWIVSEELKQYSATRATLAGWLVEEILEPVSVALQLEVDWAAGLLDEPTSVGWVNPEIPSAEIAIVELRLSEPRKLSKSVRNGGNDSPGVFSGSYD